MEYKRKNLMLVLTNQCNLKCIYCYEKNKKNKRMTFETAKKEINKLIEDKECNVIDLSFFGGEPFLEFELIKRICEWIWMEVEKKIIISVITNGSTLSCEEKEWLHQNRKKINVMLSLDGTAETQNMNRSNSFNKIDIPFFKKNWPEIGVKMTVSAESLKNLYDDIVFIHSKELRIAECNLALGIDWSNTKNVGIFIRQMDMLYHFYKNNPQLERAEIINMSVGACENKKRILKICSAGDTRYVDADGGIYPCNYINPSCFTVGELKYLMNIDFNKYEDLEDLNCFEQCYIYPLCPNCYAANYSLTGNINIRDKSVCEINKIRAYYSALLLFESLKNININDISENEKGMLLKKITAIKTITSLYGDLVERLLNE